MVCNILIYINLYVHNKYMIYRKSISASNHFDNNFTPRRTESWKNLNAMLISAWHLVGIENSSRWTKHQGNLPCRSRFAQHSIAEETRYATMNEQTRPRVVTRVFTRACGPYVSGSLRSRCARRPGARIGPVPLNSNVNKRDKETLRNRRPEGLCPINKKSSIFHNKYSAD